MKISKKAAIRSPWFIGWMALLLTVIAMNVYMISLALKDSPGLVADDYYARGQLYDKKQSDRVKSHPGWKSKFVPQGEIKQNQPTKITFDLVTKDGQSINADTVTLFIYRPSSKANDFSLNMTSNNGVRYSTDTVFKLKGVWDLVVEIKKAEEVRNFAQRIKAYE